MSLKHGKWQVAGQPEGLGGQLKHVTPNMLSPTSEAASTQSGLKPDEVGLPRTASRRREAIAVHGGVGVGTTLQKLMCRVEPRNSTPVTSCTGLCTEHPEKLLWVNVVLGGRSLRRILFMVFLFPFYEVRRKLFGVGYIVPS